jgi:hypothetical protein
MATLRKLAAVTTTLLVLAGPASAFTPTGPALETEQSKISQLWQPTVAQRGDSVAGACEGFKYAACVREFVSGNRDKFPQKFQAESDFWLFQGTEYMVPMLSEAKASAVQTDSSGPRPSMLEVLNGFTAKQEQMAAELARLSKEFGLLAVEDIDGLGDLVIQVRQQTQGFAQVQGVVQRLEEAYVQLQSGDLTSGMLNTIQAQNDAALQPIFADIEALQQADITFSKRLDVVEADVAKLTTITEQIPTTVKTEVTAQLGEQLPVMTVAAEKAAATAVEEATYWSNWLTWAALILALLAVAGVWWTRKSTNTLTKTVESQKTQLNSLASTHLELVNLGEDHAALSAEVHDEHEGLAATRDIAATALSQNSTLTFQETPDLKHLKKAATSYWVVTTGSKSTGDYQTFEVIFTKREDGLLDCSIPRNSDGTGINEPIAFKSVDIMKTMVRHAHIKGRLRHCIVLEVTAESKPEAELA